MNILFLVLIFSFSVYISQALFEYRGVYTQQAIRYYNVTVESYLEDSACLASIIKADQHQSIDDLAERAARCLAESSHSDAVPLALTAWLRENHVIYEGKSSIEADQLRGYLMYLLASGPPNDEFYGYVKNELIFSEHASNIASAAYAAKLFRNKGKELMPLLLPFLRVDYREEWVDISTHELAYPLLNPTKARYEIIKTLRHFGPEAYPAIRHLSEIEEMENQRHETLRDTALIALCQDAIEDIERATPFCCRNDSIDEGSSAVGKAELIVPSTRAKINAATVKWFDQNGNNIKYSDLVGKPFVLTFFYTRCTNILKCAATVDRLRKLQKLTESGGIGQKVGIYAMTYDPDYDSPAILKNYGETYGLSFTDEVKLLAAQGGTEKNLFQPLEIRVGFGYGSVNQHGIQLLLMDKKGRIAFAYDNELWSAASVYNHLIQLLRE